MQVATAALQEVEKLAAGAAGAGGAQWVGDHIAGDWCEDLEAGLALTRLAAEVGGDVHCWDALAELAHAQIVTAGARNLSEQNIDVAVWDPVAPPPTDDTVAERCILAVSNILSQATGAMSMV